MQRLTAINSDGVPIIWLQDISGFDIGMEAEKHGLLGYGSNLLYTNSTNTVPMVTSLLRKASGAGWPSPGLRPPPDCAIANGGEIDAR